MKVFRIYLVATCVVCASLFVGAAPTLDGLLGGGGDGDGGGLLGGLPDKSNLFGGILGGNGRSDDDGEPFQAVRVA